MVLSDDESLLLLIVARTEHCYLSCECAHKPTCEARKGYESRLPCTASCNFTASRLSS